MGVLSGISDFFGLDIGSTALRIVQLKGTGPVKSLVQYGQAPIDANLVASDAKPDQQKLGAAIAQLVNQLKLDTKNVAVGLPTQKVFTAVVDFDQLAPDELQKTIQYQADALIPTPLADSKVDWSVLGPSPKEAGKVEVLLSSATNEYIESRMDMLEGIGLDVVAFEPEALALTRAIVPSEATTPHLLVDIGNRSTDLVITIGNAPRLVRSIPTGMEAITRTAAQNLGIDQKQAEQFVLKFGLSRDKLEGQVYNAIIGTVDLLMSEIEKSVKFFMNRYPNVRVDRLVVTGGASALPEFPLFVANKFAVNVEIGNAWRNVSFPQGKQTELLNVSNHFGVAAGLAERME